MEEKTGKNEIVLKTDNLQGAIPVLVPAKEEKKIVCEVCGYANPQHTAICKKCSNYLP